MSKHSSMTPNDADDLIAMNEQTSPAYCEDPWMTDAHSEITRS